MMEELHKVADTVIEMLRTEADSPIHHPEVGHKVPIPDLTVWVEKTELSSPGMDCKDLHSSCGYKHSCLPIGVPLESLKTPINGSKLVKP